MNFVGKKVRHKTFYYGVITSQDESCITVKFESENVPRKFIYPSCFKSHLTLLNPDDSAEAEITIKKNEEIRDKKLQQITQEIDSNRFLKYSKSKNSSKNQISTEVRSFASVTSFCSTFNQAIASEITFLKHNGCKRYHINNGKKIDQKNNRYIYIFESDDELNLPEGTQITIWKGQDRSLGNIVDCEDFTVIIITNIYLGNDVPFVEFSAESWRLLNSLTERLSEISNSPSDIVQKLVCDGHKSINNNHDITVGQDNAVTMSIQQPITFIWGPPGTGKTQTLAKIAIEQIKLGNRVLMLSYSNVSVDGATMRVNKLLQNNVAGTIVRYGYPRRKDLLNHEYLTSYNLAIHNHHELQEKRQKLIAERKTISRTSPRYLQIGHQLTEIRKTLLEEEKSVITTAKFVATTVSKAIVDDRLRNNNFDVVIFDEASMAYIPQIIFSASLAQKHFVCIGDFRQLPPIVQSNEHSILNADIFQYCGITSAVDNNKSHKWLCMLNTQYRMHPDIADFASYNMYNGMLITDKRTEKIRKGTTEKNAIKTVDLSGMMSVCTKTSDNSRVNILSAFVSFSFALEYAKKFGVGVITPYHAQSRLLNAMARDINESKTDLKSISCATVHQFQGSEKDVIIYDSVDCYRMPYPGKLLTSMTNNYANRLFNVALTRAKEKFVSVTNISYMKNKNVSEKLMFGKLINHQNKHNEYNTWDYSTENATSRINNILDFFNDKNASIHFFNDIKLAKHEIRIDIPDKPFKNISHFKELASILQGAIKSGIKVCIRAESKSSLPEIIKPMSIENPYVANPITLIDKQTIWFGMPFSDAQFKSEGRILPTKYHPIIRFQGKNTAKSIYTFVEMNKTIDQNKSVSRSEDEENTSDTLASYVFANKICPSCGKPMKMKKSKSGKFFLACSGYPSCKEISYLDVDFIEKYFYRNGKTGQRCPICSRSLEAKLGPYGIYVRCCGLSSHKFKLDEI